MQQNAPLGIPLICMSCPHIFFFFWWQSCPHIDVTTHKPFRTLKQCDKKWPLRVKSELWSASQLCSKLLAIIYLLMYLAFEKKKKNLFRLWHLPLSFSVLSFRINSLILYTHTGPAHLFRSSCLRLTSHS